MAHVVFALAASWYSHVAGTSARWEPPAADRPQFPESLEDGGTDAFLASVVVRLDQNRLILHLEEDQTGDPFSTRVDLSSTFEQNPRIRIVAGTNTWDLPTGVTADTQEPYAWDFTGADATAFQTFRDALATSNQAATITFWDGAGANPFVSAPAAVSGLAAVYAQAVNRITLTWDAPSDGGAAIIDYQSQRRVDGVTWESIEENSLDRESTIDSPAAGVYDFRVRARNSAGNGPYGTLTGAVTVSAAPPTPTAAVPDPVPTVEVDWSNDGTFGHAVADVTGDLVKRVLRSTRGRTLQSRRKATAGRMELRIWNLEAKYDPLNPSSPIHEAETRGIRVRLRLDGVTVWGGVIDDIRYTNFPVPYVEVIALGRLSSLRQPVNVEAQSGSTIGSIAQAIGTAAGVATAHLSGGKNLDLWAGLRDEDALTALQDLEETEEGFLYERFDGDLVLEADGARSTGASAISALFLKDVTDAATDIPLLRGSRRDWGFRNVANVIRVPVETLETPGTITLWTGGNLTINAGASLTFHLSYPDDNSPRSHRGVSSWITPVSPTDFAAQTGLSVTGATSGEVFILTLRNTSASAITIPTIKVRGVPIVASTPLFIEVKDAASISTFGEIEYQRPSPLFTSIEDAQEYADGTINRSKSPHGWLVARWPAFLAPEKARSLDISRRITVLRGGEEIDYFIEGISIALVGYVRMEYLLSPVPGATLPAAPVIASVARASDTSLDVVWAAPFDGGSAITGYSVQFREQGAATWMDWMHTGTGVMTTITGLTERTSYEVQVAAINAQGTGPYGSAVGFTSTAPAVPVLSATVNSTLNNATLVWTIAHTGGLPVTYLIEWRVRNRTSSGAPWGPWGNWNTSNTATESPLTLTSGQIGTVNSDTQHQFRIRAMNTLGTSAYSNVVTRTGTG